MYYYLVLAPNGTQYVATPSELKGENIMPLTEEQFDIILDIYRSGKSLRRMNNGIICWF